MQNPHQPPLPAPRTETDSWLLTRFGQRPGYSQRRSLGIIALMVAVIGWVDYLTGVRVSLELFYVIPIMLSVAWLGWRAGCVTSIICIFVRVGGDLLAGSYNYPLTVFWNRLGDLCIYWVVVWTLHALISLWRQLDERVHLRTAALEQASLARQQLQNQLFDVSRRERSAIGHDLHDGLGQHLTAISIAANLLAQRLENDGQASAPDARTIVRMLRDSIGKTRQIARGLLLATIEPDHLIVELEEMIANLRKAPGVEYSFKYDGKITDVVDVGVASHIFYIAQEAAGNAVRHGRLTKLEITLVCTGARLELTVADNGRGLPPLEQRTGMGLRIMEHRAELIGGHFELLPNTAGGTTVRCVVPLAAHLRMPAA